MSTLDTNEDFVQLATGVRSTCGLRADGTVRCFGASNVRPRVPDDALFSQIDAKHMGLCGVHLDGSVSCYGIHEEGVPVDDGYVDVSVSLSHACARKSDGTYSCCGETYGQAPKRGILAPLPTASR